MKDRLKDLAEILTSKRAWTVAGVVVALAFLSNPWAITCATVTGNVYIICKTWEQTK